MANPVRRYDEPRSDADPRLAQDPYNQIPPLGPDPLTTEPRAYANDPVGDPRVDNRVSVQAERGTGTSVLIAAVVIILAIVAYFAFAPGTSETVINPEEPAVTVPTEPAVPQPGATAPAAPADPATPAPESSDPAPAAPAPTQPAPAPAQ